MSSNNPFDQMHCPCGVIVSQTTFHDHIEVCLPLQNQLRAIYLALGKERTKMQPDNTQFIHNILFLLKLFTDNTIQNFPDLSQNLMEIDLETSDFDKVDIQMQEQLMAQIKVKNKLIECSFCHTAIQQHENSIPLPECWHEVHKVCLTAAIMASERKSLFCETLGCKREITQVEQRQYLSREQILEMERGEQQAILQGGDYAKCPACSTVMQVSAGMADYKTKDLKGEQISSQAADHMAKFRVRCKCEQNFCSSCNIQPYHVGKTCDQLKEYKAAAKCRVCEEKIEVNQNNQAPLPQALWNICDKADCRKVIPDTCTNILKCGHACGGFKNEAQCLPCLDEECYDRESQVQASEFCAICYIRGLGQMPCVRLDCQHVFHLECIRSLIGKKWVSPRIVFSFLDCPSCKTRISAPHCEQIVEVMAPIIEIEKEIIEMSVQRAKHEGLDKHKDLLAKPFCDKPVHEFYLFKMAYYSCYKCKKPYFGGLKDCIQAANQEVQIFKEDELFCATCSSLAISGGVAQCQKHGTNYIDFKCRFCCSVSLWFCFGTTHFCDRCHTTLDNKCYPCGGAANCPLKIQHPKNGKEYALGCGLCRGD